MQTEVLKVTGMSCGGCVSNVTQALKAITGVSDVQVSLSSSEVTVQFDERVVSPEQLKLALRRAGYGVDATKPGCKPQEKGGCCCG
jgi:copper chaperone CopZ